MSIFSKFLKTKKTNSVKVPMSKGKFLEIISIPNASKDEIDELIKQIETFGEVKGDVMFTNVNLKDSAKLNLEIGKKKAAEKVK